MKNFMGKFLSVVLAGVILAGGSKYYDSYKNEYLSQTDKVLSAQSVFDSEIGEVTETEEDLEESLLYLEVKASVLNVRDDVMGNKISKVKKGDRFYIFDVKDDWYLILLNENQAGWVCGKYVDVYYPDGTIFTYAAAYGGAGKDTAEVDPALAAQAQAQQEALAAAQAQQEALLALQAQQQEALAAAQAQQEALLALQAQQQQEALAAAQAQQEALAAAQAQQEALLAAQLAASPWLTKEWTSLNNQELIQWVIASCITPGMSQYEQCVAVNNFLCNHMTYDLSYYTTHDAIMYGRGRCQGYANAYKDIMNTLGVPTDYVRGYGKSGRHGWNRVNIGGVYYYVDVTWNDSTGSNNWLMVSEAQILQDHIITQYSATNTQ